MFLSDQLKVEKRIKEGAENLLQMELNVSAHATVLSVIMIIVSATAVDLYCYTHIWAIKEA